MSVLLGVLIDLLLIATLSRHPRFWLALTVITIGGFSMLGELTERVAPDTWNTSMELVGGAR
jgi:hypothetical protein